MGFRFLTESSALGFSENINLFPADSSIEIKPVIYDKNAHIIYLKDFQEPAKFHIGMLSISLIAGLAYGGYVTYNCWREKNVFLSYIRNLVIALTCRTFFSLLFGVIILESPLDVDGGNTLLSFECISLNLVVAFWLTLTVYIHARVQRNFNSEPSLKLYMFGVPGVAVYFAMVQIFAMEGTHSSQVWWLIYHLIYFYQWVVNSLRLLYLLIQLALLIDIGRMMVVKSTDNDTVSLIRKVVALMAILVLLFWLQFGLSVGRPPENNPRPYLYFYYLIDGTQCALVCIVLFFFNKWVPMILDKLLNITMENGEIARRISTSNEEVLISGDGGRVIVTIGSLFMKEESGRWTNTTFDGREDVVYSSVVQPHNLQKTIDLYKRLNVIPADKVTIVKGEEFYDCDPRNNLKRSESLLFKHVRNLESGERPNLQNKMSEKVVRKNAFYSSKYLIVDPKEKGIPRYLETRPCVFPRKESLQEEHRSKPPANFETLRADELVKKWLTNHSIDTEAQQKRNSFQQTCTEKNKVEKEEVWQIRTKLLEEHRPNESKTISPIVNSDLLGTSSAPEREESISFERNPEILNANNNSIQNLDIIEVYPHKNQNLENGGISALNDQSQTEKNFKEILDPKVAEEQAECGIVKIIEINERGTQKNKQNDFQSTENFQEPIEQRGNFKKIFGIQTSPKDDTKEMPEEHITDAIHATSKKKCYINASESSLEETVPSQEKKNLLPMRDTERGITLKDEPKASDFRSEAEIDTEKLPETLVKNNLFENEKDSDLKNPQDFQSLSNSETSTEKNLQTLDDSGANDQILTYSKLLAFRSQRDELEKENSQEKNSEIEK